MVNDSYSQTETMCNSQPLVSNEFIEKLNRLTRTKVDIVETTNPVFNVDQATTVISNYLDTAKDILLDLFLTEDINHVYEQRNSLSDISTCMQETIDHLLMLMNSLESVKNEAETSLTLLGNPLSTPPPTTTTMSSSFRRSLRRRPVSSGTLHLLVAKIESAIVQWNTVSNLVLDLIEKKTVVAEWAELNFNIMGGIETEINACTIMLLDCQEPEEPIYSKASKSLSTKIFHFNMIQKKLKHLQASLDFLPMRLKMFERKADKLYSQAIQDLKQKYGTLVQKRDDLSSKVMHASSVFGSASWSKVLESICLEANQLLVLTERSFRTDGNQIKDLVSCFDILERASKDNLLPVHLLEQKQDLDCRWTSIKEKLSLIYTTINNTPVQQLAEPARENSIQSVASPVVQRFMTSAFCSPVNFTHSPSNSLFSNITFSPGHSCQTSTNSISLPGLFTPSTPKLSSNLNDQVQISNETKTPSQLALSKVLEHTSRVSIEEKQQHQAENLEKGKKSELLRDLQDSFHSEIDTPNHTQISPDPVTSSINEPLPGRKPPKYKLKIVSVSKTIPFVHESSVASSASTRLDIKSAPMICIDASPAYGMSSRSSSSCSNSFTSLHSILPEKYRLQSRIPISKSKIASTRLDLSPSPDSGLLQSNEGSTSREQKILTFETHTPSKSETIRSRSSVDTDPALIHNGRPLYSQSSSIPRLGGSVLTLNSRIANANPATNRSSYSGYITGSSTSRISDSELDVSDMPKFSTHIHKKAMPLISYMPSSQHLKSTTPRTIPGSATNRDSTNSITSALNDHISEPAIRKRKTIESFSQTEYSKRSDFLEQARKRSVPITAIGRYGLKLKVSRIN
jgi:hypothetical protein